LVISLVIIYLFGYTVSNSELAGNKLVLASLAWPVSGVGYVGIICAMVGAASQALHGFVRNLHAITADRSLPFLSFLDKKVAGDRIAHLRMLVVMWLTASIPCLSGDLDYIVSIVAVLYLVVYGALNSACFMLSVTKSPNFRPHFKYYR
jgi:hypothetical protein